MSIKKDFSRLATGRIASVALVICLAAMMPAAAQAQISSRLSGGPKGAVKSSNGVALEGIMVQLISQKSAVRTTVYSNEDGRYEFPKLETGVYTLRIARPLEFYPFVKEGVAINGANQLEDIVLERITSAELLPPFPEIAAQLTGAEWMLNLSGTADEKNLLRVNCNWCHSYQQIFRNRYDDHGWERIVFRMTHGAGSPLINVNDRGRLSKEDEARLAKWLATVRGPESKDQPFMTLPRPKGRSTRAIITEYELPRLELATHDVAGDSKGNLWYSPHRSSYIGRLDPRTGAVKEYKVPVPTNASLPGVHWIWVDHNDVVWGSENWAHNIVRFDPRTEQFSKFPWKVAESINSPMGGNYAIDPEGFIWKCRDNAVFKADTKSGDTVKKYDLKKFHGTYGSAVSWDGRYFGGGAWPQDGVVVVDSKSGEIFEADTSPNSGPARGEFDPQGNYWSGGRGGVLVEFEMAKKRVREYPVPTPYGSLYTAKADKNGEVWAGELQGGRYLRFNPKNQQWTEYLLPEPYGHDRESWIDNSTTPVTVWYVDHDGWMVRIQPLE
jgi:virginiamycin B lyase